MSMEERLNPQITRIPPSGIRKFFDVVNEMPDAISLGVGEPDFVTPWNIRQAGMRSLEKGMTGYTSNWGTLELRREIARYLEGRFGLTYDPADQILVTIGASEAIDLALRALLEMCIRDRDGRMRPSLLMWLCKFLSLVTRKNKAGFFTAAAVK